MKVLLISPYKANIDIDKLSIVQSSNFELSSFDERVVEFSNRLSKRILADKVFGRVPALTSLAYWLRKSNLLRIKNENLYLTQQKNVFLGPIGIVFHVCPANVDTMFIYSLMISLLMGNKNILRVSNRLDHEYISFLFDSLNSELSTDESSLFKSYINVISYEHENEINEYFSGIANARLIWGGDNTAKIFRGFSKNPRIKDIVFSDRISISIFKCKNFLELQNQDKKEIVRKFYNDSYTFDQRGCSSPQSIFILGEESESKEFEREFYHLLEVISTELYISDEASLASMKFNQLVNDVIDEKVNHFLNNSVGLYLIGNNQNQLEHSCGGGYFYTYYLQNLKDLRVFINNKTQTLSYFGLEKREIDEIAQFTAGHGVDRIVPIGKALDFDFIWDGYNLCEELSSKKQIL
jgi:hypothetical protein